MFPIEICWKMRKKYLIKAPSFQTHITQEYSSFINSSSIRMQGAVKAYKKDKCHNIRVHTEGGIDPLINSHNHSLTHGHNFRHLENNSCEATQKQRKNNTISKSKENISSKGFTQKSHKHLHHEYRYSEVNEGKGRKTNPFIASRYSESKSKGKQAPRPTLEKQRYVSPTSKAVFKEGGAFKESSDASLRHLLKGTKIEAKGMKKYRQAKTCLTEGD